MTVEIADGERKRRDWDAYWEAREACMKAGVSLQLVGTDDMIEAASEAAEFLLGAARGSARRSLRKRNEAALGSALDSRRAPAGVGTAC